MPTESEASKSVLKALFGDDASRVATWFTGHLIVPTGEIVNYVHMGYGSTYSSYIVVTVVPGDRVQVLYRVVQPLADGSFEVLLLVVALVEPDTARLRASVFKSVGELSSNDLGKPP